MHDWLISFKLLMQVYTWLVATKKKNIFHHKRPVQNSMNQELYLLFYVKKKKKTIMKKKPRRCKWQKLVRSFCSSEEKPKLEFFTVAKIKRRKKNTDDWPTVTSERVQTTRHKTTSCSSGKWQSVNGAFSCSELCSSTYRQQHCFNSKTWPLNLQRVGARNSRAA